jgi:hypothetical protein
MSFFHGFLYLFLYLFLKRYFTRFFNTETTPSTNHAPIMANFLSDGQLCTFQTFMFWNFARLSFPDSGLPKAGRPVDRSGNPVTGTTAVELCPNFLENSNNTLCDTFIRFWIRFFIFFLWSLYGFYHVSFSFWICFYTDFYTVFYTFF